MILYSIISNSLYLIYYVLFSLFFRVYLYELCVVSISIVLVLIRVGGVYGLYWYGSWLFRIHGTVLYVNVRLLVLIGSMSLCFIFNLGSFSRIRYICYFSCSSTRSF